MNHSFYFFVIIMTSLYWQSWIKRIKQKRIIILLIFH